MCCGTSSLHGQITPQQLLVSDFLVIIQLQYCLGGDLNSNAVDEIVKRVNMRNEIQLEACSNV
jgi:hypothetical protein